MDYKGWKERQSAVRPLERLMEDESTVTAASPPTSPEPPHAQRPKTRPKTAQIRADQWTSLDELARELHDARRVKGERITANTLIRVAIDGLVAHGGRLHGDNEEQLLASWLEFLGERKAVSIR